MTDTWGTGGLTIVECLRPLGCPTKQTKQKKKKKKQICFNDKNIKTLKDVRLITLFLFNEFIWPKVEKKCEKIWGITAEILGMAIKIILDNMSTWMRYRIHSFHNQDYLAQKSANFCGMTSFTAVRTININRMEEGLKLRYNNRPKVFPSAESVLLQEAKCQPVSPWFFMAIGQDCTKGWFTYPSDLKTSGFLCSM